MASQAVFIFALALGADPAGAQAWEKFEPPGQFVVALANSADGIWVGTEDKGAFRFDPLKQAWLQVAAKTGLGGDDNAYALSTDKLGRLWIGTLRKGVSVGNGESWKTYGALDGLAGERVFDIACSPVDGDVWIATSAGITRYSQSKDAWTYYGREDGLPEVLATALAFDAAGTLYVGMQSHGLAVGTAKDRYRKWTVLPSPRPDEIPVTPTGTGFPCPLINAVHVAPDGIVYVGTCAGLVTSRDGGRSWSYLRGRDYSEKVRKRRGGAPPGWQQPSDAILARLLPEDYVTTIASDADGNLYLGFRRSGAMILNRLGERLEASTTTVGLPDNYVTSILPQPDGRPFFGTYGAGLCRPNLPLVKATANAPAEMVAGPRKAVSLPGISAAPTDEEIEAILVDTEPRGVL